MKTFATHSDGETVENQKITNRFAKKLRKAQRRLSKMVKDGKNREKQRTKVTRIHRKIRNIRKDFQHKQTRRTIAKCDVIVLENLNVKGMMKNHHLAKAIADCAWHEYKRQLKYKALWYGKVFVEIDRFEPTSKVCHKCGWKDNDLKLSDRVFRCEGCGLQMDRDLNAAINIRDAGVKILWGTQEYTLGETGVSCRKTGAGR